MIWYPIVGSPRRRWIRERAAELMKQSMSLTYGDAIDIATKEWNEQ